MRAATGDEGGVWECKGLLSAGLDSFWSVNLMPMLITSAPCFHLVNCAAMLGLSCCPYISQCICTNSVTFIDRTKLHTYRDSHCMHILTTTTMRHPSDTMQKSVTYGHHMQHVCAHLHCPHLHAYMQILSHPRSMTSVKLAWLGPLCMWVTPSRAGALPSAATAPSCVRSVRRYWKHKRSCRYISVPLVPSVRAACHAGTCTV